MKSYLECWTEVAASLFSQALAGERSLSSRCPNPSRRALSALPLPLRGREGRFSVVLDPAILDSPLVGGGRGPEGRLGRVAARGRQCRGRRAIGQGGKKMPCREFEEITGESKVSRAFQLRPASALLPIWCATSARAQAGGSACRTLGHAPRQRRPRGSSRH